MCPYILRWVTYSRLKRCLYAIPASQKKAAMVKPPLDRTDLAGLSGSPLVSNLWLPSSTCPDWVDLHEPVFCLG
jgi:hypothetical protein